MLNPLIHWKPGTTVRYHGSQTSLHGTYQAHPCDCHRCDEDGSVRFRLVDEQGTAVLTCVRARSLTPA